MKKFIVMFILVFIFMFSFGTLEVQAPADTSVATTQEVVMEDEVYLEQNVYSNTSDSDIMDDIIPDGFSLIVTLIVTGGVVIILIVKHNSANRRITASNYIDKDGYIVKNKNVKYIRQYEKVYRDVYKQNKN